MCMQLVLTQILQGSKIQLLVYFASSAEDSEFIFGTALKHLPLRYLSSFLCYQLLSIAKTIRG